MATKDENGNRYYFYDPVWIDMNGGFLHSNNGKYEAWFDGSSY